MVKDKKLKSLGLTEDDIDSLSTMIDGGRHKILVKLLDALTKLIEESVLTITLSNSENEKEVIYKRLEGQGARKLATLLARTITPKTSGDVIAGGNYGRKPRNPSSGAPSSK